MERDERADPPTYLPAAIVVPTLLAELTAEVRNIAVVVTSTNVLNIVSPWKYPLAGIVLLLSLIIIWLVPVTPKALVVVVFMVKVAQ